MAIEEDFHDRVIVGLGEIKGTIRDLTDQVRRQNGRVGYLEEAEKRRHDAEVFAQGKAAGEAQLSRRQLALVGGVITLGAGIASIIADLGARVL